MDVNTDRAVLPVRELQNDISWVPTTPAKPSITNPNPICGNNQENEAVNANWLNLQINSQRKQEGFGKKIEMEIFSRSLPPDTRAQNVVACPESTDSVNFSRGLDCREAASDAKSQVYGQNASIYNSLSIDDADNWNVSYGYLLALAQAAESETGVAATTSSLNAVVDPHREESQFQKLATNSSLQNHDRLHLINNDQDGSSILGTRSFDLNLLPGTMSDIALRENMEFQFGPITPDQATRAYKEQVFNMPDISVPETRGLQEKELTVRDVELNEVQQNNEHLQLHVDQSSAGISTELQDHAPDKGGNQGSDLNKTPEQKPRRKKHRPKVVIEGQPKRTPKPRTPKAASPEGSTPKPKRKYVRRNVGSTATPQENGTDAPTAETPGFEGTPVSKRKYVRRKGVATATPPANGTDTPTAETPGVEGTPVSKRKYVRRKGVKNPAGTPVEDDNSRNGETVSQRTRSSCRRSLNFDFESQEKNDSSPGMCSSFENEKQRQNLSAQDHSCLNMQLLRAMESRIRITDVGIAHDLSCSWNQFSQEHLSSQHDNSISGHQKECKIGKCQVVFSDATHDKEANVVQMMSNGDQCLRKSPSSSNCSSSACLTQDRQTRGSKRQHFCTKEAEFCSTNVTGAHYNSMKSYVPIFPSNESKSNIPIMHFPAIHKKRRTEKVHKSTICRAESTVTAAESCSTRKASPLGEGREKNISSEITSGIEAAQYDPIGLSTRYTAVDENRSFNSLLALGDKRRFTRKRSKGPTQVRASLRETCKQLLDPRVEATTPDRCMEDLVSQIRATVTTKKRSKRNSSTSSSIAHLFTPPLAISWEAVSPVDQMIERFSFLDINAQTYRFGYQEHNALIAHQMKYSHHNALVVRQSDGTVVPFKDSFEPARKRRPRPKVDLDDETSRVWKLLLEDINSDGIDGTDEEKAKWWEEERRVFRGRADSFIARMHLVQGDRQFSPWKGSVVDSVVGVFLTQNVSDHLSSSAFMSLAAQYPLKSYNQHKESHEEQLNIRIEEPEIHILEPDDTIAWHEVKSNQPTSGQGSITQQYMELNGENEDVNSCEVPGSSFCGTKSIFKSMVHLTDSSQDNRDVYHDSAVVGSATEINQTLANFIGARTELDEIILSQNPVASSLAEKSEFCSSSTFEGETTDTTAKHFSCSTSFVQLLQMAGSQSFSNQGSGSGSFSINGSSQSEYDICISENKDWSYSLNATPSNITLCSNSGLLEIDNSGARTGSRYFDKELCEMENSELSAESANQTTDLRIRSNTFEEVPKSSSENENSGDDPHIEVNPSTVEDPEQNVESHQHQENNNKIYPAFDSPIFSLSTLEVRERGLVADDPQDPKEKAAHSSLNISYDHLENSIAAKNASTSKVKRGRPGKEKQNDVDWDNLRKEAQTNGKDREKTAHTMDSLDWEAVRCADVKEIADTIKARGMNNMLAERIKDFLNRLVREHGSIDLEWLRDVPPDKAKEYLLSFRGLGLKSVECVRLLTLYHLAFPVDTNVGRIAVRLGWVPLQPLPESLQLHLLELYPILESIQKYLWPRLCKLDQKTLYELHYQLITFGKVFCTKSKPNCNACPLRGECRHFASAFASARLALPAPEEKSIVRAAENQAPDQNSTGIRNTPKLCLPHANEQDSVGISSTSKPHLCHANEQHSVGTCCSSMLCLPHADEQLGAHSESSSSNPIIEVPATPEPTVEEPPTPEPDQAQEPEPDIEDFEDSDEIPTIKLKMEEFTQNLQMFVGKNMELQEHEMSKALVALTAGVASIPQPKLKNINRLRTEHHVYELPDSHPLLQGFDRREPDDPCPYLLAIWTPGETANSVQPPERSCSFEETGRFCDEETCFSCNSMRETSSQIVRGTILIPCRTAMRGSFPLNGTYFQVNEVFADHESSLSPIDVPRSWIWNLPRRIVYFGTSVTTIFRGLSTEEIQYCFWRGFVCVRGFEQKTRAPKPLMARLHFPASKMTKGKGRMNEE